MKVFVDYKLVEEKLSMIFSAKLNRYHKQFDQSLSSMISRSIYSPKFHLNQCL
jgi:hypothetical protein